MSEIKAENEIGSLEKVLVHEPGNELDVLTQDNTGEYLFDEKPDTEKLVSQHREFVDALRSLDVDTVELEDLFPSTSGKNGPDSETVNSLVNLLYVNDLGTVLLKDLLVCNPLESIRKTEGEIFSYLSKNQEELGNDVITIKSSSSIEGGDIFIPTPDCLIIGNSLRTSWSGIKELASKTLPNNGFPERILTLDLPKNRDCMHLDLVFSQLDRNTFLVDKKVMEQTSFRVLYENNGSVKVEKEDLSLKNILEKYLDAERVSLLDIETKQGRKEQKTCGINVLPIKPGQVVAYKENSYINNKLENNGIEVIGIEGSELVKGHGGPRCMSLPLYRKKI